MTEALQTLPHINLKLAASGTAKSQAFPKSAPPQTIANLGNRQEHGEKLQQAIKTVTETWQVQQQERDPATAAPAGAMPLLMQADAAVQRASLKVCGIEVVTDLGNGYLIGAAINPDLKGLQQKIELFLNEERGGNKVSGIWEILDGSQRLQYILSPELLAGWQQLQDEQTYVVDVGVACVGFTASLPRFSEQQTTETEAQFLSRLERWQTKRDCLLAARQTLQQTRLEQLRAFMQPDGGQVQDIAALADSFTCRLQMLGRTLKDLVLNFPYLFEVTAVEQVAKLPQAFALPDTVCLLDGFAGDRLPPCVVQTAVDEQLQQGTKLFLHPLTAATAVNNTHMSAWAAALDDLTATTDCLFIVPAHGLAPPAESLHALTVGVLGAIESQASAEHFCGPGIWDTIKPEVVAVADTAAQVAQLVAAIATAFPSASCLLHRALLVHSARWTDAASNTQVAPITLLRQIGYGIPALQRASSNASNRITYCTQASQGIKARQAHVYQIKLPEGAIATAPDLQLLIEVTLSYKARPARTRRGRSDYLSTWLHWEASQKGEPPTHFSQRTLKDYEATEEPAASEGSFRWTIGTRKRYDRSSGALSRFSRSAGTLQKDWTQTNLTETGSHFCLAVIGHEGWDNSPDADAEYALVVSFETSETRFPLYSLFCTA